MRCSPGWMPRSKMLSCISSCSACHPKRQQMRKPESCCSPAALITFAPASPSVVPSRFRDEKALRRAIARGNGPRTASPTEPPSKSPACCLSPRSRSEPTLKRISRRCPSSRSGISSPRFTTCANSPLGPTCSISSASRSPGSTPVWSAASGQCHRPLRGFSADWTEVRNREHELIRRSYGRTRRLDVAQ